MSASFSAVYSDAKTEPMFGNRLPLFVVDQLKKHGISVPLRLVRQVWVDASDIQSLLFVPGRISTEDLIDGFLLYHRFVAEHAADLHAGLDEWFPPSWTRNLRERAQVDPAFAVWRFLSLTDSDGARNLEQAPWSWHHLRDQLLRMPVSVRRVAYEVASRVSLTSTTQPVSA
ncbi:MAG TPA: hypothetical protein VK963_04670 [Candidatus Saccharimonadales bacterium]|nr:hypothetical protein [Candidatus Saccharimonadales bacterium]